MLIMFTFLVMSVTGALSFFRPFSIKIVGLHALMGFIFMAFIVVHILNNSRQLRGYLKSSKIWLIIAVIVGLSAPLLLPTSSGESGSGTEPKSWPSPRSI